LSLAISISPGKSALFVLLLQALSSEFEPQPQFT
jgi:hypothetical protein